MPTEEELMAFADGMLDPARAAEVERAVAADPALAAEVALFRETAALLADFGQAQPTTIPEAILAMAQGPAPQTAPSDTMTGSTVTGATVIDLAARRINRQVPFWQLPLAASIFLALGVAGTIALRPAADDDRRAMALAVLESAPLHEALQTLPSGETRRLESGNVTMVSSFTNADKALCREFEYVPPEGPILLSVSCHRNGAWGVQMAVATSASEGTGYVPASSMETLDAYLMATGAAAPLSPEAETAALHDLP